MQHALIQRWEATETRRYLLELFYDLLQGSLTNLLIKKRFLTKNVWQESCLEIFHLAAEEG